MASMRPIKTVGRVRGVGMVQALSHVAAAAIGIVALLAVLVAVLWWRPAAWLAAGAAAAAIWFAFKWLTADRQATKMLFRLNASGGEYAVLEIPNTKNLVAVIGPMLVVGRFAGDGKHVSVGGEQLYVDGRVVGPLAGAPVLKATAALSKLAEKVTGRRVHALGAELYWGAESDPMLVETRRGAVAVASAAHLADVAAGAGAVLEDGEAEALVEALLAEGLTLPTTTRPKRDRVKSKRRR